MRDKTKCTQHRAVQHAKSMLWSNTCKYKDILRKHKKTHSRPGILQYQKNWERLKYLSVFFCNFHRSEVERIAAFNSQELSNTAFSFATVRRLKNDRTGGFPMWRSQELWGECNQCSIDGCRKLNFNKLQLSLGHLLLANNLLCIWVMRHVQNVCSDGSLEVIMSHAGLHKIMQNRRGLTKNGTKTI